MYLSNEVNESAVFILAKLFPDVCSSEEAVIDKDLLLRGPINIVGFADVLANYD